VSSENQDKSGFEMPGFLLSFAGQEVLKEVLWGLIGVSVEEIHP
jgi:hypothetical protein